MGPRGLGQAEIEAFGRDGFVVVRGLFGAGEMARVAAWADEVENWPETPGRHMMYFEQSLVEPGKRVLNRLENFYPHHPDFAALCDGDQLMGSVSTLLAEPAVLFKEKINFKLPGGDGFAPHQDQQAGWSTYAPLFVTALVSIDEATVENGCLELAAGHHKAGLIGAEWTPLSQQQLDADAFVSYPTKPGDAVFFDSYAPHGSKPNLSQRRRRLLYVTYNAASHGDHRLRYYADKRNSYPPDVEREPGKAYAFRV